MCMYNSVLLSQVTLTLYKKYIRFISDLSSKLNDEENMK